MSRPISLTILLATALFVISPAWGGSPPLLNVCVVRADTKAWLAEHAAKELSRYMGQMTGATVLVVDEAPLLEPGEVVFRFSLVDGADKLDALPGADDPERLRDGFLIQSEGEGRILIAATAPNMRPS